MLVITLAACLPAAQEPIRTIALPTHTGANVDDVDTFTGELRVEGDCFYYLARDGSTILPIWPSGYTGQLGPRFRAVFRPGDPPDNPFNAGAEILEFHGERLVIPEDLDVVIEHPVLDACRHFNMFLVLDTIQLSQ